MCRGHYFLTLSTQRLGVLRSENNSAISTMCGYVTFSFPLDLASTLAGGVVGFLLVFLVDWVRKPRVRFLGFVPVASNAGTLHKLRFKIWGFQTPGLSSLNIEWCCRNVFAKWDETPNPQEEGESTKFRPELVPSTYYQPLFCGKEYTIPIIIESHGKHDIFSGWWFGRKSGYGPDPAIEPTAQIRLTLTGAGLSWSKPFSLSQICGTK